MALVFSYKGHSYMQEAVIATSDDLKYFSSAIRELIEESSRIDASKVILLPLDILDLEDAGVEVVGRAASLYKKLFVHRGAQKGPLSGLYPPDVMYAMYEAFATVEWPVKNALITIFHYLQNEALYEVACRVYANLLCALSFVEIKRALGYEEMKSPSDADTQKLYHLVYGKPQE